MKYILNNQVVAISGGAGLIGQAFCRSIVESGGKVIIGDLDIKKASNLISDLGSENAFFYEVDIRDPLSIDGLINKGKEKFGKIDAAVHCAYPRSKKWGTKFEELKPKSLEEDLFNQLGGSIIFSQRFVYHFKKQGYGNLVHIASIHGISAPKFEHYSGTNMVSPIEYGAIKAGVLSVTRYLAKYCKDDNIRVNCISPGGILSDQPKSFIDNYRKDCVSKGMLDASDICGALLFILSDSSKYITGQNIVVDDGWSL